ncbi:MAG: thiamine diphosphokinase [Eubacteriales bacterium]|nr:thiamine diphosphokinase [Eubacteriales bacterium]
MNILIVSGGSISLPFLETFIKKQKFDRVIAADAGLAACHAIGLIPTDILGDFDSLSNLELREYYREQGIPVREFPTRKDFTDTHLAMLYAMDLWKSLKKKEGSVYIVGALGTRMDHGLANIGLLMSFADQHIPAYIVDDHNEMEIVKGPVEKIYYRNPEKMYFSILPFSSSIKGVDLIGFSYPLENAELKAYESMGISNEITEEKATLRIKEGYALIVQACD